MIFLRSFRLFFEIFGIFLRFLKNSLRNVIKIFSSYLSLAHRYTLLVDYRKTIQTDIRDGFMIFSAGFSTGPELFSPQLVFGSDSLRGH